MEERDGPAEVMEEDPREAPLLELLPDSAPGEEQPRLHFRFIAELEERSAVADSAEVAVVGLFDFDCESRG